MASGSRNIRFDTSSLKFAEYFEEDVDERSNNLQNVLAVVERNVLIWSEKKKTVLSVNLNDVIDMSNTRHNQNHNDKKVKESSSGRPNTAGGHRLQRLTLSQTPLFDINFTALNSSGQYLVLYGDHGVNVLELPRQWGKDALFEGGKEIIMCRSVVLAEQFFVHHYTIKCLQVLWYPGSPTDSHVVILTSDNCLRIFEVNQPDEPLSTIHLFEDPNISVKGSFCSFATVFGELAIGFDFGPPIVDTKGNTNFPMFVMQESGDTWILYCKLHQNRFQVVQRGPLMMNPPSDDNYGSEFTSIICLPTSPPVLTISTSNGNVHHCIVLETEDEEEETSKEIEDNLSTSHCNTNDRHLPDVALFVYETVQLDLTLLKTDHGLLEIGEELPTRERLKLFKDCAKPTFYYCLSTGGIHTVQLPWIKNLENFCISDHDGPELSAEAEVTFVLCTKPTENCSSSPLLGAALASDCPTNSYLLCLLNNGEFITRPLLCAPRTAEIPNDEEDDHDESRSRPSPLRNLPAVGSFDRHIQRILKRNSTAPLIRSAKGEKDVSPELEYYQLLTNATKILREEYIQKLSEAKIEVDKRCKLLRSQKEVQLEDIRQLLDDRELNDNAENLAEKLATASDNMQILTDRLSNVLRIVQSSLPILSQADSDWAKEVKQIQQNVLNLKRYSEAIKRKYENLFILGKVRRTQKKEQPSQLSSSQSIQVRSLLKQQSNRIAELVDDVKTLNLQVGS